MCAFSWADHHLALTAAPLGSRSTVAFAISNTGRTKETVECLRIAREHGSGTICMTNAAQSPIVADADLVLLTHARESKFRAAVMATRTAQLSIIDVLFILVAQMKAGTTQLPFIETRESVQPHKILSDE